MPLDPTHLSLNAIITRSSSLFKESIGGLLKRILHHRVLPRKILQHNISNLWLRGRGYFCVQTVNEYGSYEVDARSDPMQSWLFFCHSSACFPPTYKYIHHLDLYLFSWLTAFHSKLITCLLSPVIFTLPWFVSPLGDTGWGSIALLQWAPSAASSVTRCPTLPVLAVRFESTHWNTTACFPPRPARTPEPDLCERSCQLHVLPLGFPLGSPLESNTEMAMAGVYPSGMAFICVEMVPGIRDLMLWHKHSETAR